MSTKHKIAAIQMASGPNTSANLLEAERLVAEATDRGARLVVLPENFAFMGKRDQDLLTLREEPGDGPLQEFLGQIARRYGVWLVGGTVPLTAKDAAKLRAACLVYDDQGRQVARYDKLHLFDVHLVQVDERYTESATIEAGDKVLVLDSPFGRMGVAVCYDLRFPEQFRNMLDLGVELLVVPSAFTAVTGKAHWEILVRARAIENLCYVVAAAQGGYHVSGRETHGHSMIVDPWGTILAEAARGSTIVCEEIKRPCLETIRRTFPSIYHRRLKCR
jgi:nitrilase